MEGAKINDRMEKNKMENEIENERKHLKETNTEK